MHRVVLLPLSVCAVMLSNGIKTRLLCLNVLSILEPNVCHFRTEKNYSRAIKVP